MTSARSRRARVSSDDPIAADSSCRISRCISGLPRFAPGLDDRNPPMDGLPHAAGSVGHGVNAQGRAWQRFCAVRLRLTCDPWVVAAPRSRELRTRGAETNVQSAPHDLDRAAGRLARLRRALGSQRARRCEAAAPALPSACEGAGVADATLFLIGDAGAPRAPTEPLLDALAVEASERVRALGAERVRSRSSATTSIPTACAVRPRGTRRRRAASRGPTRRRAALGRARLRGAGQSRLGQRRRRRLGSGEATDPFRGGARRAGRAARRLPGSRFCAARRAARARLPRHAMVAARGPRVRKATAPPAPRRIKRRSSARSRGAAATRATATRSSSVTIRCAAAGRTARASAGRSTCFRSAR